MEKSGTHRLIIRPLKELSSATNMQNIQVINKCLQSYQICPKVSSFDYLDTVILCYLLFRSGIMSFVLPSSLEILVSVISNETHYPSTDTLQLIKAGKSINYNHQSDILSNVSTCQEGLDKLQQRSNCYNACLKPLGLTASLTRLCCQSIHILEREGCQELVRHGG